MKDLKTNLITILKNLGTKFAGQVGPVSKNNEFKSKQLAALITNHVFPAIEKKHRILVLKEMIIEAHAFYKFLSTKHKALKVYSSEANKISEEFCLINRNITKLQGELNLLEGEHVNFKYAMEKYLFLEEHPARILKEEDLAELMVLQHSLTTEYRNNPEKYHKDISTKI